MVKQNLLNKGTILNLDITTTDLLSVHNHIERKCNIKETEKKQKAKQLVLFAKSLSSDRTSGGFFKRKKLKKDKSKSKLRPTDMSYHTCSEKKH